MLRPGGVYGSGEAGIAVAEAVISYPPLALVVTSPASPLQPQVKTTGTFANESPVAESVPAAPGVALGDGAAVGGNGPLLGAVPGDPGEPEPPPPPHAASTDPRTKSEAARIEFRE